MHRNIKFILCITLSLFTIQTAWRECEDGLVATAPEIAPGGWGDIDTKPFESPFAETHPVTDKIKLLNARLHQYKEIPKSNIRERESGLQRIASDSHIILQSPEISEELRERLLILQSKSLVKQQYLADIAHIPMKLEPYLAACETRLLEFGPGELLKAVDRALVAAGHGTANSSAAACPRPESVETPKISFLASHSMVIPQYESDIISQLDPALRACMKSQRSVA